MPWEAVESHTFKAYFADAESCKDNASHLGTYTKPAEPVIDVAVPTFSNMDCDKSTYSLSAVVTYTNQDGTLYAWLDDDSAHKKSFTYNKDKTIADDVTISLTDLVGDGAAHQLNIEFDGAKGCRRVIADGNAIPFTAPFTPVIGEVNRTPSVMACGATTYTVTVEVPFSANAIGKTLTITGDTGTEPTTYTASTPFSHTFTVNKAEATGKFHVYFADAENCEIQKTSDYPYSIPNTPEIDAPKMEFSALGCADVTTTLTFDLEYTYQQGKLYYNVDGAPDSVKNITENSSWLTLKNLKYKGIPADGKSDHVLNIVFSGANSCERSYALPTAPTTPNLANIVVTGKTPTTPACGETTFTLNGVVSIDSGIGDLVITDVESGKSQTIAAGSYSSPQSFSIAAIPADGLTHTLSLEFLGDPCSPITDQYTAPSTPNSANIVVTGKTPTTPACGETTFTLNGSLLSRGLSLMIVSSFGSAPKAIAGKESVTRFTHKMWIANKGVPKSYCTVNNDITIIANIVNTSAILLLNKKRTVFLILA